MPTNGDTYIYANSIEHFTGPIIHFGYYVIGSIFFNIVSFFGLTPVESLGYLSAVCASFAVLLFNRVSFFFNKKNNVSIVGAVILLLSGSFWFFSIHGEVYIPQLTFIVLSIFLLLKQRSLLSSFSFLASLSITPSSILALPALFYLLFFNRLSKKQILYFIIPLLTAASVILLWDISKVIEILNRAIYSPAIFFENFNLISLIKKVIYDLAKVYIKSFNIFLVFMVYGFIKLFNDNRKIWILMILLILPFSAYILNLGLISGDHLIITFIPLSYLSSYGLIKFLDKLQISSRFPSFLLIFLFCIYGWFSYQFKIAPEFKYSCLFENLITNLDHKFDKSDVLVSQFDIGVAFWYLTQKENNYYLQKGEPNNYLKISKGNNELKIEKLNKAFWINIPHFPDFFNSVDFKNLVRGRRIYFIEKKVQHSWIVEQILPESFIKNKKQKKTLQPEQKKND